MAIRLKKVHCVFGRKEIKRNRYVHRHFKHMPSAVAFMCSLEKKGYNFGYNSHCVADIPKH